MNTRALRMVLAAAALAACAGPQSRIRRHQAAFDAYPPAVQQKIRDGQVDVGFTAEQASLALGRPDRTYSRKTAGADQEVWAYGGGSGGASIGFGMGLGMGGGGYGGGIGVASGTPAERDDRVRVILENGVVTAVESRQK